MNVIREMRIIVNELCLYEIWMHGKDHPKVHQLNLLLELLGLVMVPYDLLLIGRT